MADREADLKLIVRADASKATADLRNFYAVARNIEQDTLRLTQGTTRQSLQLSEAARKADVRVFSVAEREKQKLAQQTAADLQKLDEQRLKSIQRVAGEEQKAARETAKVQTETLRQELMLRQQKRREEQQDARASRPKPSTFMQAVYSSRFALPGTGGNVMPLVGKVAQGGLAAAAGFASVSVTGGVAQALEAATGAAIKFEAAMANVNSIAQLGNRDLGRLKDQVLTLAKDPSIVDGPEALAKSLYDIYSSGFVGQKALDVLRVSAQGASAGLTDTATSSRVLMAVLNSGIPGVSNAKQAMDVLFQIVNDGVINFEQLSGVIGAVLPTAAKAGISLQQVGAAIAVMTKSGQSGAEATNDLLNLITHIANPSREAEKQFRALGISYGFVGLQSKGLPGVLAEIEAKTHGNADAIKRLLPDMQAQRAVLSLLKSGGKEYADSLDNMSRANDGAGATAAANSKQQESLQYQIKQLQKEFEIIANEIGPAFIAALRDALKAGKPLLDTIKSLAEQFHALSPEVQESYLRIGGITALAAIAIPALFNIGSAVWKLAAQYRALSAAAAASAAQTAAAPAEGAAAAGLLRTPVGMLAGRAAAGATGFLGVVAPYAAAVGIGVGVPYYLGGGKEADDLNAAEQAQYNRSGRDERIRNAIPNLRDRQKALLGKGRNYRPRGREGTVSDQETMRALQVAGLTGNASVQDIERAIKGLDRERRDGQNAAAVSRFTALMDDAAGNDAGFWAGEAASREAGAAGGPPVMPDARPGRRSGKPRLTDAERAARKSAREAESAQKRKARQAAEYAKWYGARLRGAATERYNRAGKAVGDEYDDTLQAFETLAEIQNVSPERLASAQQRLYRLSDMQSLRDDNEADQRYRSAGGGIKNGRELNPEAWEKLLTEQQEAETRRKKRVEEIDRVLKKRATEQTKDQTAADSELFKARQDYEEGEFKKLMESFGEFFRYGDAGKEAAETRAREFQDAMQQGGLNLFKAARTGKQTDFQSASDQFDLAKARGGGGESLEGELAGLQAAMSAPGSRLGQGQTAPLILRRLKELRGDADATGQDELVLKVDDAITQFQAGMKTAGQQLAENAVARLSENAKGILTDLLTGKPGDVSDKFKNLGRNLLGGIVGDVGDNMAERFNRSVKAKLAKAFLDGKAGFGDLFKGAEMSAARIAATGYGLLHAMMTIAKGGKQGTAGLIGGVLGGIAGSLIPGVGPLTGFGIGSSLGTGDFVGAALQGLTLFPARVGGGAAKGTGTVFSGDQGGGGLSGSILGTGGGGGLGRSAPGGNSLIYVHNGDNYDRLDRNRETQDFIDQASAVLSKG